MPRSARIVPPSRLLPVWSGNRRDSPLKTQNGGKIPPAARRFIQSSKTFSVPPNQPEVPPSTISALRGPAEPR